MIESYAYDIIKQEGFEEGMQQGKLRSAREVIFSVLEARFELVPENIIHAINQIDTIEVLDQLHRRAVKVRDLHTFSQIIQTILTPV